MSESRLLRGVIVPLTTPFDSNGEIEEACFAAQIEWMLAQGVHGMVIGGSTGEGNLLEEEELLRLAEIAVDVVRSRVPVLASIIVDSTRAAVKRARALSGFPLAALQVAPPHYIFSPSDAGLTEFYGAVAEASTFPVIVYNVVSWANVSPALAAQIMSAAPKVIAVKQSDKNFVAFADLVESVGPERVFAAIDSGLMSCYDLGVAGSIAAIASAAPGANVRLWDAVQQGRRDEALTLHRRLVAFWAALSGPNLPARVKIAQELQGMAMSLPRAPMAHVDDADRSAIASALLRLAGS